MKCAFVAVFFLFNVLAAQAQPGRYLVRLKDKGASSFSLNDPAAFLSARSMARRARYHIPYDSTDLPVNPAYIDSIKSVASVTVLNVSKWLNQVSIQISNAAALDSINHFSFVQSTTLVASRMQRSHNVPEDKLSRINRSGNLQALSTTEQTYDYGAAAAQVNIHNGAFLHNMGLQGQDMIVSLLDAGYYHYTSLNAFDSVNHNGQVLGTWDFVMRDSSVAEDHPHGMECFSTMAANLPGTFVGTAPKASFYLFRSEDAASEYEIEEHNWVCAAERADSAGGDVISSSLGYNLFDNALQNHQYSDLNGDKTMAARAADLAAKKGLLVVNAAGNEGANAWKYIMTPADADSILVVGAVDKRGQAAAFSSYGPSADAQVKPDVASVGVNTIIQGPGNTIGSGNGTSFACPNMAGLATCLWQGFPEVDNMKLIDILRRSGNNFLTPNDRVGYGIPDMKKAVQLLLAGFATVSVSGCNTITWTSKDVSSMRYEIERQKSGEPSFTKIAEQSGTGTVFQTHQYQFADPDVTVADDPVHYRIRQVLDTAATSTFAFFIDTVTITMALTCTPVPASEKGFQIVPNPVQQAFQLKIDNGAALQNLQLVMVNAIGQTIYTERTSKATGMAIITIKTTGLPRGLYYLAIYDGVKRLATKRFIKL